jgi:hypothetical protein
LNPTVQWIALATQVATLVGMIVGGLKFAGKIGVAIGTTSQLLKQLSESQISLNTTLKEHTVSDANVFDTFRESFLTVARFEDHIKATEQIHASLASSIAAVGDMVEEHDKQISQAFRDKRIK